MRKKLLVSGLVGLLLVVGLASTAYGKSWNRHGHGHHQPTPTAVPTQTSPPPTESATTGGVFTENFNSLSGWNLYNSKGHDGNGLRRPSQITVSNGIATITGLANGTTGGMSLLNHPQRYGQWSIRMKAPAATGLYHPVALLWGIDTSNPQGVDNPLGEVDIAEFWQRPNRDVNTTTLHYGDGSQMVEQSTNVDGTGWHTYNLVWMPTYMYAWIDDKPAYFHSDDPSLFPKKQVEVCLQLDWFPGEPFPKTGATLQVDWVKVYPQSLVP